MSTPSEVVTDYGVTVFPQHAAKLAASGVSADVAQARGYRSADTKAGLQRHGFGTAQRRPPALVIPLHGVTGEVVGYQCRPDEPRSSNGRIVKYETPSKQHMVLDVPPGARDDLDDPAIALFITEGPIKADAAVSAGLCCVALLGVWSWRGTNDKGGKVSLPAFEQIALNERRVVIAFDSDAHSKPGVHEAMARLGAFLRDHDAHVQYLYLPHGDNGTKVGLDDFLAGHPPSDLWDLVADELRPLPGAEPAELEDDFADVPEESGAELLDDVEDFVLTYCSFACIEEADAIALWVVHTHVVDVFSTTPRLLITAPTIECGKSRVLESIEPLVLAARLAISVSGAYMFRTIGVRPVTLLLDEYEALWKDDSDHGQDLRAIIDAGYRKGQTVGRVVGSGGELIPVDFPVFCPVALAGVGWVPESVRTRSIPIHMRRRGPDDVVQPYDRDDVLAAAAPIQRRIRGWAKRNRDRLDRHPELPAGVEDRPAELWRPLVAVAQLAGGTWPDVATAACLRLVTCPVVDEDPVTQLLADIEAVFDGTDTVDDEGRPTGPRVDTLFSTGLVERLNAREDWPWSSLQNGRRADPGLTPAGLAKRLKDFGVKPKTVRIGNDTAKGYWRAHFTDAWTRFARTSPLSRPSQPSQGSQASHPRSSPTRTVTGVTGVTATEGVAGVMCALESDSAPFDPSWEPPEDDQGDLVDGAVDVVLDAFPGAELFEPDDDPVF